MSRYTLIRPGFPLIKSNAVFAPDAVPWIVRDDGLELRGDLYDTFIGCCYQNAEHVIGMLVGSPDLGARTFGMTRERFDQAFADLKAQLRGKVDDELLDYDPTKAPIYPLGCDPPTRK